MKGYNKEYVQDKYTNNGDRRGRKPLNTNNVLSEEIQNIRE